MIGTADIGGLVLAGGAGARMAGADKGLQTYRGVALAQHAANRLAAQVATVTISANRNLEHYRRFGHGVIGDAGLDAAASPSAAYAGPLAGIHAGLVASASPWLAVVPCDAPYFPLDLVVRLAAALAPGSVLAAVAATRPAPATSARIEPTFCLLHRSLAPRLAEAMAGGERKASRWLVTLAPAIVEFADAAAFANVNTIDELARLEAHG